jgi:hypothetical protein
MSVVLNRVDAAAFCLLGDPALTSPYYPGLYERPNGSYIYSSASFDLFRTYPTTSPSHIVKLIRISGTALGSHYCRLVTGSSGGLYNGTVTQGFPPMPISGSPFYQDDRSGGAIISATDIFPRWVSETPYDLNTFPATANFTPQGIPTGCQFNYLANGLSGSTASMSVSYDSGVCANDPIFGGDSTYEYQANFSVLVYATDVCCWNKDVQLELNLEIYAQDFSTTYVSGTYGNHDINMSGSPYYHSTLTQTVTIDEHWMDADIGLFHRIHIFDIPKVNGAFTFANDFYISSVTAP